MAQQLEDFFVSFPTPASAPVPPPQHPPPATKAAAAAAGGGGDSETPNPIVDATAVDGRQALQKPTRKQQQFAEKRQAMLDDPSRYPIVYVKKW